MAATRQPTRRLGTLLTVGICRLVGRAALGDGSPLGCSSAG
jgi:hypothetical protein